MATENPRRIPLDKAASFEEISDAINSLTRFQLKQLEKYARWRIKGLGRKAMRREWRDLFHDTIESFCSEDGRRWDKERVDIVKALKEAMRSISDYWNRSFDEKEAHLESELITTSIEGTESNPINNVADPSDDIQKKIEDEEKELADKRKIEKMANLLAKRELASLIFLGMREGMTGKQIREDLELSQTQFETEMTWIRRTIRTAFKEE